ncbi:LIC_10190 family membrane protein [Chryseobacterium gambrini]|uniref:LIC_10190 family membrane protein n=1 Tax=Chryseobacterium gambrini TaxID=373672 RepID=UPI003BA746A0
MILLLFSTLLLIPVLMGTGKIVENFSGKLIEGISGKILLGILGISLSWTILAFFIPLNRYVEFSTIAIGLVYFFKDKLYKDFTAFSKKYFSLVCLVSLIILFSGSFYPYILDHFGYYVPTIKWLTELGLVKGISNLDLTLGQMSVWHIFQAGFSNFSDPFLRINSVVLIIYTLYIIEKKSWIQLCFIPVLLLFCQSPSPDLPVIVFSLIILNEILKQNKQTSLLFAFSVFVFAIKPTMIWLPVLSFLYSLFIVKSSLKNLIFGILIVLLFFIKNIYTFGYPVFPVSIIDLGVNWKPNPEILKISSQFAIQKTYDMQYSYEEIQKFSTIDYIRNWLFLNGIKAKINLLFIVSLIIFVVFTFIKKNRIITFICISLIVKSVLVLLFSAQYRFFMDVFFVIFFILLRNYFNQKKSVAVFSVLSILFISFLTFPNILKTYFPSFNPGSFMGKFEKEQLYNPSVYESTKFDSFRVGNLNFNVSSNYPFNYDSKLPAISAGYVSQDEKLGIFPQLIDDKNLKKGFIWKKLNDKEKKQAKSVIYTINPLGK